MQEYTAADDEDLQEPTLDGLNELQQLASYQEPETEDVIPAAEFDEADDDDEVPPSTTTVTGVPTPGSMLPPSRGSFIPTPLDESEPVPHKRHDTILSKFVLAMGLWCEDAAISRSKYASLREILRMLEPNDELANLPDTLSTLKRWTNEQMPLLQLRRKQIPLEAQKLPSAKAAAKEASSLSTKPTEYLYFFDPKYLFTTFLSSPEIRTKIYIGLGEFRDVPVEIWQSRSWNSSVRTTSGQYAHYPNGHPMFPSDFVRYLCLDMRCPCHQPHRQEDVHHFGRILEVAKDYRSTRPSGGPLGAITVKVQRVVTAKDVKSRVSPVVEPNELIPVEDLAEYLLESGIRANLPNVHLLYSWESSVRPQQGVPPPNQWFVRRLYTNRLQSLRPLCQSHPIRAELELSHYTRQHFVEKFDKASSCLSVPLLTFIDGFGLYRNMYRTLMGMYLIIAAFSFRERARRANVLPLTLGPHGSNFPDVVGSLSAMLELDAGVILLIEGKPTYVCVFTLAYVGDMPQQQENSGFKSQNADYGCRFCTIHSDNRATLDFDIVKNGRYHHEVLRMRKEMSQMRLMREKNEYAKLHGLDREEPPLPTISPALDIIVTRPSDPAHSEYGGIAKSMHILLMEAILTGPGAKSYAEQLRSFPYPPGWARLQSPLHHLGSYRFGEHARWSVIIPNLLRCWLDFKHIKPDFLKAMDVVFQVDLQRQVNKLDILVTSFASVAKANTLLMSAYLSAEDRNGFQNMVKTSRRLYQRLHETAAQATWDQSERRRSRSTSRSSTPTPAEATRSTTPVASENLTEAQRKAVAKSKEYLSIAKRPNLHIGLHYELVMEEYAMPSNCNVLIGEDKHRKFKDEIYSTNHSNVEKALLSRENMRQTCRLILLNAFVGDESVLTQLFKELHQACPTLFESLLPRSEQMIDEDESSQDILGDVNHERPAALVRIAAQHCKYVMQLPTWSSLLSQPQRQQLGQAYTQDYKMSGIVHFGRRAIPWCKKFSFTDPLVFSVQPVAVVCLGVVSLLTKCQCPTATVNSDALSASMTSYAIVEIR